mgnify:CR=1 FL=1
MFYIKDRIRTYTERIASLSGSRRPHRAGNRESQDYMILEDIINGLEQYLKLSRNFFSQGDISVMKQAYSVLKNAEKSLSDLTDSSYDMFDENLKFKGSLIAVKAERLRKFALKSEKQTVLFDEYLRKASDRHWIVSILNNLKKIKNSAPERFYGTLSYLADENTFNDILDDYLDNLAMALDLA